MTRIAPRLEHQSIPTISDEMLNQIVNAVSFSGDHEIARLATAIKNLRSFKQGLAASDLALRHASEEYDQALCFSLYRALHQANAIAHGNALSMSTLHCLWKDEQNRVLDSDSEAGLP